MLDTTELLHFHFSLSCIGEGNGNPLQCSCLENPRDGGAWLAAVYGVTQGRTRLKWLSSNLHKPWRRACQPTQIFLLGESSWMEEPGRLQSMASQRVGHNWATEHSTGTYIEGLPWWLSDTRILLPMLETRVWSLGQEDPMEKEMATHSSILAWEIPWIEQPGRLQSTGFQKSWRQFSNQTTATTYIEGVSCLK